MVISIQGEAISINALKVIDITREGYIHPGREGAISLKCHWEPRSGRQPCYRPQELLVLLFNPQVCESITISFLLQSESVNLCLSSRRGLISKAMEETKSSAASGGQSSPAAATQQTTNNTPSPISPTPNSPKPISPTPSLLFRSREASSDGSISPCKFISSSDYILN